MRGLSACDMNAGFPESMSNDIDPCHRNQDTPNLIRVPVNTAGRSVSQFRGTQVQQLRFSRLTYLLYVCCMAILAEHRCVRAKYACS